MCGKAGCLPHLKMRTAAPIASCSFLVERYDLDATLSCGQAFNWEKQPDGTWTGTVSGRWVRLRSAPGSVAAETAGPVAEWAWLEHYLQARVDLAAVHASFPADEPMRAAVAGCPGLRLLRQEPWECLASFILSSTKQIVQIRRIVRLLCERYGAPAPVPSGEAPGFGFPGPSVLAGLAEADLRACQMGFRARYLRETALAVEADAGLLDRIALLPTPEARAALTAFPGVGPKIADCVLLFAYGRQDAFPLDVWMIRALGDLYFPKRRAPLDRLRRFAATHFGPNAGFAQQYIFHHARRLAGRADSGAAAPTPRTTP